MHRKINFDDIWNTSEEDKYILFNKQALSDSSYFLSNIACQHFDNFILGHTVYYKFITAIHQNHLRQKNKRKKTKQNKTKSQHKQNTNKTKQRKPCVVVKPV